jgi:2-isopropylmalate synthase
VTRIELYDATLRDGMQGAGLTLTAEEKLRVVHKLDELGVGYVEAGFPASNPKEAELFALLERETLSTAQIAAFGMTRRRDAAASDDPGLRVLAESFAPVCTIVGKTWGLHLDKVVKVGRDENLAMIEESVAFLTGEGKRVIYDAEHFFDAFRDDEAYAIACLRAAMDGGAERVVLCDTNGSSLMTQIGMGVLAAVKELGHRVGIHCHDDAGCGVANTLMALDAGATHVQGTMNGVGERTGNANLVTIIANVQLKLGLEVLPPGRLAKLTETAHFVDELLNRTPDPRQPYVGKMAFTHKGGLHAAGVRADPATFEHIDPAAVGNRGDVLVSELAGRHSIEEKAGSLGIDVDAAHVLQQVKALEHAGFQFEAADASFELLLRREAGVYEPLFVLESWRVIVEQHGDNEVTTEAVIKIRVGEQRVVRHAEGNGPVNALDTALRRAISEQHPHLADIDLVNYKVRILDETKGTDAVTRVLIDSTDRETGEVWGTIGVHENVIAASWQALVDSLAYAEQPSRVHT